MSATARETAAFMAGLTGYGAVMSLGSLTVMLYPPLLLATGAGWAMGVGRLGAALGPLGAGVAIAAGMAIGRLFYFGAGAAILIVLCLVYLARGSAAQENPSRIAHP